MKLKQETQIMHSRMEINAWRDWCIEFENTTNESINSKKFNKLVALIERWGIRHALAHPNHEGVFQKRLEVKLK